MTSRLFRTSSLPMIFQAESNECGLACLAMISTFYGYRSDLHTLRTRFGSVALGSSVKHLMNLAAQIELRGRALRFELDDLRSLKLPAIVHWDMDHFVVIKKMGSRKAIVHDPASGIKQYTYKELSFHLTGVALELTPTTDFQPRDSAPGVGVGKLFDGVDLIKANLVHVFVMTLVIQAFALLNPLYLQLVIDQGLIKGDAELVIMLGLIFSVVVLIKAALMHLRGMYLLQLGNRIGFQLLGNTAHHLLCLPSDFFSRREMGDIVSRFGSLENIRKLITQEMVTIIVDGMFSLVTLFLLYLYSPGLATIVLLTVCTVTLIRLLSIGYERNLRKTALVTSAKQQTKFMENIRTIRTSKVNNIELDRLGEWESDLVNQLNSTYRLEAFQIGFSTFQTILLGIENIVVIYLGATAVIGGMMTLGQLMSFVFLKQHFSSSIFAMLPKTAELRMLNLELERVSDILSTPVEFSAKEKRLISFDAGSTIQLIDVSVNFPGNSSPLISDLKYEIEPGDCIALTGRSGCGKTTLLKTFLKLEPIDKGRILIDGQDLEVISRHALRDQISAILHEDGLMPGDLAYNIHLGVDANNQEKLLDICDQLGISEIVKGLPLGLCTEVGELSNILSAGQIQRILLARALYRAPRLLLLDEALSHLNSDAAISLLRLLKKMGTTIVLVSHDTKLVSFADRELKLF